MKLSLLIKDCSLISPGFLKTGMTNDPDITYIASNSRDVKPGGLFIAVKGFIADGHDYIEQALKNGAIVIIAESNPKELNSVILVKNSRLSMASIAANFYNHPSRDMTLVGITGTNGKTTTSWILESIFKACKFSTGVIGTINIRYNDQIFDNPVTTPDSIALQKSLSEMKKAKVTHVIMEVSSHGLDLRRVDYCKFDAGVFTNLSQDHLDYHRDMDEYFNCKKRFFTRFLGPNGENNAPAVVNIDDPKGSDLLRSLDYKTIGISTKKETDIFVKDVIDDIKGLSGTLCLSNKSFPIKSQLTGKFNLENILCAAGAAHALNIKKEAIQKGIKDCHTIPGRLEKIENSINRYLFVDYAHTPDALESILTTLKLRAPKRLITVFGCGGDRDRSKRPLMGQIACKYSDIAIATSDNPRSEDPDSIIIDVAKGMDSFTELLEDDLKVHPFKKGYLIEIDRKKALEKAIFISKPGDIIVAAGKGHETYQITNEGTIHFDDAEELQKAALKFQDQFTPIPWTTLDLSKALACDPVFSNIKKDHLFSGICTDSRAILQTQIFLALKGDNFDGHDYIKGLVEKGIKGFIMEKGFFDSSDENTNDDNTKKYAQKNLTFFETKNTLKALGKLAQYQKIRSKVKLLAITGSSGKTTTRKIVEEIFKTKFHTLATKGNFNNEIGLPLTLLNLSIAHEWAIVEMGMNHAGEIARLSKIAQPDIAMVTNTAGVHLEGLGSVDNVAKAKAEIFEGIRKNGTAILFADDARVKILKAKVKENKNIKNCLFFGSGTKKSDDQDNGLDVISENIKTSSNSVGFTAVSEEQKTDYSINSPALFMVDNCLAAILAAKTAGICTQGIKKGITAFTPVSGRMNIYKLSDSINIIDDTYNANPSSVAQALETLETVSKNNNSITVLGDMLELGKDSDKLHWQIGKKVALLGINKLFVFGNKGKQTIKGAIENGFPKENTYHGTKNEIAERLLKNLETKTWILVKGSRGMSMESIIQEIKQNLTANSKRL